VTKTASNAAAAAEAKATGRSHQRQGTTDTWATTAARNRSRAACDGLGTSGWVSSCRFNASSVFTHAAQPGRWASSAARASGLTVPKW